jgi:Tfp pilus assembly protein PilV
MRLIISAPMGFTLIELLLAIFVLTFGLLAAGCMLAFAASSGSMTRSMDSAVYLTQQKLEQLSDEFRKNAQAPDLLPGNHTGPTLEVSDASGSAVINRFRLSWSVQHVSDQRSGFIEDARLICVTAVPIAGTGETNLRSGMNKSLAISSIIASRGLP